MTVRTPAPPITAIFMVFSSLFSLFLCLVASDKGFQFFFCRESGIAAQGGYGEGSASVSAFQAILPWIFLSGIRRQNPALKESPAPVVSTASTMYGAA